MTVVDFFLIRQKPVAPWVPYIYMFFGMDPAGHQQMPVSRERMIESGFRMRAEQVPKIREKPNRRL